MGLQTISSRLMTNKKGPGNARAFVFLSRSRAYFFCPRSFSKCRKRLMKSR